MWGGQCRTYINPNARGTQIVNFSRAAVCVFGILMGVLAVLLNVAGVSLGWVYLVMGAHSFGSSDSDYQV